MFKHLVPVIALALVAAPAFAADETAPATTPSSKSSSSAPKTDDTAPAK